MEEYGTHRHFHQDIVSTLLCFLWMLCALLLRINEKKIHEVDCYEPTRPLRTASKSLPPRTGYIPGQSMLKAFTRAHQHPLAHWSEYSRTSKLAEMFMLSDTLHRHCQYQNDKAFFSLLDSEMLEAGLASGLQDKYSWRVGYRLHFRLGKKGDERDSAAHHEYLSIMNERSLELIDLCVDILRRIS